MLNVLCHKYRANVHIVVLAYRSCPECLPRLPVECIDISHFARSQNDFPRFAIQIGLGENDRVLHVQVEQVMRQHLVVPKQVPSAVIYGQYAVVMNIIKLKVQKILMNNTPHQSAVYVFQPAPGSRQAVMPYWMPPNHYLSP